MIQGQVNGLQAQVGVVFRLPNQPDVEVEFVVDTGFDGALPLPPAAVAALGLPFFQEMDANLANDVSVRADVHVATIIREGQEIDVLILAMGRRPLLGTVLLAGKELVAQFVDNGIVTIDEV
jgi:clan AA aspartic protease